MGTQTASVYSTHSVPRLRVTRRTPSPTDNGFGTEDGPVSWPMPAASNSGISSEDDSDIPENVGGASRLLSVSLPRTDSNALSIGKAHRLRAILCRFDASRNSTPSRNSIHASHVVTPPSPSDLGSDFDLPPVQAARASIKDLFRAALKEPGETPRKQKPTRRASFNAMDSPKVEKSRRTSMSDEETENSPSCEKYTRPSELSTAASLDRLRLQLTESLPSVQDISSGILTSHPLMEASTPSPKRPTLANLRAPKILSGDSSTKRAATHRDLEPFNVVNEHEDDDLFFSETPRALISARSGYAEAALTMQTSDRVSGNVFDPIVGRANSPSLSLQSNHKESNARHEIEYGREQDWNDAVARSTDVRKGHRRTTTELSESVGSFPRQSNLSSGPVIANDSNLSLFADESVPPPQTSTPTFKTAHLADFSVSPSASDDPLPSSPGSPPTIKHNSIARGEADFQRLQRAVAPDFTFPLQQHPPSLSTPDTPPSTPSSSPPNKDSVTLEDPAATLEPETCNGSPPSSIHCNGTVADAIHSSSVPLTPMLPGAYRLTPGHSKRKGILKVRFDGDIHALSKSGNGTLSEVSNNGIVQRTENSPPPSPSSDDVPPTGFSPSRRKALRLVDEYGRERRFTEDGEEIFLNPRRSVTSSSEPSKSLSVDDSTMTPRRRSKMRQVDALGNEVSPEAELKDEAEDVRPAGQRKRVKAVFSQLTRSLGELRDDLAEEEDLLAASVPENRLHTDERLLDLAAASKVARIERNKLARKLQLERHAEGGFSNRAFMARHPSRDVPLEAPYRASWWRRKWQLVLILFLAEAVLIFIIYRLATIHAKQYWLATYFDPFFPALYLHKSKPSFLRRLSSLPVGWSAFAIPGAVQRVGVRALIGNFGEHLWARIVNWRLEPWEEWGSPAGGPHIPRAWPPS